MTKIAMIAAMANNRAIGKDNALPWHLPNDLRFFKESTMGKPIVMGRKTFESIGRPLPGRENFVVTLSPNWSHDGVWSVHDLEIALKMATNEAESSGVEEVMVIGGAQIYKQALPYADRLYLTLVDTTIDGDAFFPEFNSDEWEMVSEECHASCEKNPYDYRFQILDRKTKKS